MTGYSTLFTFELPVFSKIQAEENSIEYRPCSSWANMKKEQRSTVAFKTIHYKSTALVQVNMHGETR